MTECPTCGHVSFPQHGDLNERDSLRLRFEQNKDLPIEELAVRMYGRNTKLTRKRVYMYRKRAL